MKLRAVIVIAAVALLMGATSLALSVEELAEKADLVVRVRVTSAEAEWVASSARSRIVTFHEAQVLDVVGGALNAGERERAHVRVGTLGGAVGDIEQRVSGAPRLVVGREYVLFLGFPGGPSGARGVVGMWQGAWDAGPELPASASAALQRSLDVVRAVRR